MSIIKDAYPKKVCHMPTRHVKKMWEEKKIAPIQRKRNKREMVHTKEFIHHPPKYPHTCTSWSKFMTCFSFGSGFWLSKIWEAGLPLYPPCLQLHQKEALGVGWKERHKNMPWWGIMHKWAIWEIIEELYFSFRKCYKTSELTVEQKVRKWHSTRPFRPSTAML